MRFDLDDQNRPPQQSRLRVHSLEYPIVEHCNLRCGGCDHSSPLLAKHIAGIERFEADLKLLEPVMVAGDFRIIGGEPLLHPLLVDFLRVADASPVAESVTLVTNGVLIDRAPDVIWDLIDRLWVSSYPRVRCGRTKQDLQQLCAERGVILDWRDITTFRHTVTNYRNSDPELVKQVYKTCKLTHEWLCYTVYDGAFYKCAPSPFIAKRHGLRLRDDDSVKLTDDPRLKEHIQRYLDCSEPLESCTFCLGSSGRELPVQQLNAQALKNAASQVEGPFSLLIHPSSEPES